MPVSDPQKEKVPPRRSRRGFRLALLALALILAGFHRPLILKTIRFVAIRVAASRNLALDFKIGGGLYGNLVFEKISATATGPSALRELAVGSVQIDYSLPDLIRKGPTELVKSVALRDARLVLDPSKESPEQRAQRIKMPSVFPKQVELRGVNLLVRHPDGDWEITEGLLTLFPDRPGMLGIGKLKLPGGRQFENLGAATSYRERNFVVKELGIGPEVQIGELNLDLTDINGGRLGLRIQADLFQGEASLVALLTRKAESADADVKLSGTGISLASASQFLGLQLLGGNLDSFKARVSGDVNQPASWKGAVSAEVVKLKSEQTVIDHARATLELGEGKARLIAGEFRRAQSTVSIRGSATLPPTLGPVEEASGNYEIRIPKLAELGADYGVPEASGVVGADGNFQIASGRWKAAVNLTGNGMGLGVNHCETLAVRMQAGGPFPAKPGQPGVAVRAGLAGVIEGMEAQVSAQTGALDSGEYHADGAQARLALKDSRVELKEAVIWREQNWLLLGGSYLLPEDPRRIGEGKMELDVDLNAPNLEAFSQRLGGAVALQGSLHREKQVLGGNVSLSGSALRFQELVAESVSGEVAISENKASVKELRVDLGGGDFANATGEVVLAGSYPYKGRMEAKVRDLSVFQPVLRAMGRDEPIGGALNLNWNGTRKEGAEGIDSGRVELSLRKGKFGVLESLEAAITGTYSGQSIQFPQFRIGSNKGSIESTIYYSDSLLSIQNLTFRQGTLQFLTGNAFIPVDLEQWRDPAELIPPKAETAIDLYCYSLDLKQLSAALGKTWPASGSLSASFRARGPMEDMKAVLELKGRDLKAGLIEKLAPAKLDLALNLDHNRLALKTTVVQEDIKPLVVLGELPFDLRKILVQGHMDEDAPLKLSATLERSSLGFLSKATPEIRYIEGEMSLQARAGGTIRQPVLSGAALFDVPALRFRKPTLPAVANFRTRLTFVKDQLAIDQFGGEIGGGPFAITGRASFPKITEPVLDLRATSKNLLIERNNSVTVRANADLLIKGPLKSGTVSGTVGITNSRFFREVEILPIGLPGRPARRVPRMDPQLNLPQALHDWHFDIKIRTDDPFKVRSNLANGGAEVNLLFRGTGAKPALNGEIQIQNLAATLPFSKMNVDYGYLYFTPRTGLDPVLDIHGTSELRDYSIDIYIHGSAQDPQTIMTSDPPLPQEDIVALLATGATVKEIGGSPDILAGRAAVLLFDRVYRKIFKRAAPSSEEPVPNRIQFDLGGVSSTTGKQELTTQFKLTDQIYLLGEVGIEGSVGGKIKYVMRFR